MNRPRAVWAVAAVVLLGTPAAGAEVDPATLYELSTEGSSTKLRAGERGRVVIEIRARPGAHVSDQAPLKINLDGRDVELEKQKLTLADSTAKKEPGKEYADPRFEVGFKAAKVGKAAVDARLVFFICTDKLCARQQKALSFPVEIN